MYVTFTSDSPHRRVLRHRADIVEAGLIAVDIAFAYE